MELPVKPGHKPGAVSGSAPLKETLEIRTDKSGHWWDARGRTGREDGSRPTSFMTAL